MTHNRATNLDAARLAGKARNKARREDVASSVSRRVVSRWNNRSDPPGRAPTQSIPGGLAEVRTRLNA